jgi:hypothetical protein
MNMLFASKGWADHATNSERGETHMELAFLGMDETMTHESLSAEGVEAVSQMCVSVMEDILAYALDHGADPKDMLKRFQECWVMHDALNS